MVEGIFFEWTFRYWTEPCLMSMCVNLSILNIIHMVNFHGSISELDNGINISSSLKTILVYHLFPEGPEVVPNQKKSMLGSKEWHSFDPLLLNRFDP